MPSASSNSTTSNTLASLRMTAVALISAPLILGVMLWFILPEADPGPLWAVAAGPLLAVLGFLLAQMVGYPRGPLESTGAHQPDTTPPEIGRESLQKFHSAFFLRFALAEGPLILAFVLAFVVGAPMPYYAALGLGLLSLIWHVWPSDRIIDTFVREWEQGGQPSYLREALKGSAT